MARDRQRSKQRRRRQSADGGPAARPAARPAAGDDSLAPDVDDSRDASVPRADADPAFASGPQDDLDAARDAGVEDVLDEVGPEGTTPAPDPLKHASPYVDEAKLAEAGVHIDGPDGPAAERAPDDLQYAASHADSSGREGHAGAVATAPGRGRATTFLRNSAQELRRVHWPDRRQTGQGTAVTLGFVVLAGGFLGLMDAIWRPIVEAII